jgi:tungstate transport system ATP-binding protein
MAGVFQKPFMFDGSVADNVAFGLRARGMPRKERDTQVAKAIDWLGLTELATTSARRISGGEAQRVALARALAVEPDILLLDEPTSNLDVTVRRRFREDLERLARTRARAAILITHDPTDAFSLADRIAVMQGGRIVQVATPEELVMDPATPFIATFTGAELLLDGAIQSVEQELVSVLLEGGATVWAALRDAGAVAVGDRVHVAYRPEDIVLALPDHAGETSAINRFEARVDAVVPAGPLVRVRLTGAAPLAALVTRRSAEALALTPGRSVIAQMKATALRAFPARGT